jgi:hypothetical protein
MNTVQSANVAFDCGGGFVNNALEFLWRHIEYAESVFPQPCESFALAAFMQLKAAGILQQAEPADCIVCPDCDYDHVEKIVTLSYPVNGCRHAIPCPVNGRVLLSVDEITQWAVSFRRLVELLAAGLALSGHIQEIEPLRIWRLGTTQWQSRRRAVLFVRGFDSGWLGMPPPNLTRHREAIVLVPHRDPYGVDWGEQMPSLVPLPAVATLVDGKIDIDAETTAALIYDADRRVEEAAEPSFSLRDLTMLINRQIKTIQHNELPDDVLIQAYVQEGSLRKAAGYLSQENEREITKDKVQRALKRAGGQAAVARCEDTDSVVRNVVSKRQGRAGGKLHDSKR